MILDVKGLRKGYGGRVLFDGVEFSVTEGEKVGMIGRNGTGKSTLFRILAGLEGPDAGEVHLRRDLRVGFLAQDPEFPEETVFEVASGEIEDPDPWTWRHRVEALLTRFGLEDRRVEGLSGGERRRLALVRTLAAEPELLLLDEPTNHLDADTVLHLEETLFDFRGAVLVITHDRYFLDRVVDRMLELKPDGVETFEGGYTEYLEERAAREERMQVAESKRKKLLAQELEWARRAPPARTGKQKARRERAKSLAEKQRERDRTRVRDVEMEMREAPRLGRTILRAEGVSKSLGGTTLFEDLTEEILGGERIGIVGPNGAGKTTLVRVLIGLEPPDTGRVIHGERTKIGYYDQNREVDPDLTVARAVSEADWVELDGRRMHLRAYLDRFLFPSEVHEQPVRSLSGGERNRVLLARLFLEEFNVLVLDEPTNDLDIDTLNLLEDLVMGFEGCVLLVTHDRYLLDKVATSLLVFDDGVHRHHGGWDAWIQRREEVAEPPKPAEPPAETGRRDRVRKLTFREKQELEEMEARLQELEAEKEVLGRRLADPDFYREGDVAATTRRYEEVERLIESLYERWLELEELK